MDRNVPINIRARDGFTPLLAAVENGQENMALWLISQSANFNVQDSSRNSCLHVAAMKGFVSICRLLVHAGAAMNLLNAYDEAPLDVGQNAEVCRVILGKRNSS